MEFLEDKDFETSSLKLPNLKERMNHWGKDSFICCSAQRLLNLRQGRRTIADYVIEFRTAAAEAGWPGQALQGVYLCSLNEAMKDQMASPDKPATFEALASLSLCIDNCLREREGEKSYSYQRSHVIHKPCLLLSVSLIINQVTHLFQALVDSGCEHNPLICIWLVS